MAFPEIDRGGTTGNAVEQLAGAVNDWPERIIALLRLEQNFSDSMLYDSTSRTRWTFSNATQFTVPISRLTFGVSNAKIPAEMSSPAATPP